MGKPNRNHIGLMNTCNDSAVLEFCVGTFSPEAGIQKCKTLVRTCCLKMTSFSTSSLDSAMVWLMCTLSSPVPWIT